MTIGEKGILFDRPYYKIVLNMKKEVGVLLAGGVGLLAVLSFLSVKKILSKKHKKYSEYYSDHHRHFDKNSEDDDHGIEFYAFK